MNHSTSKPTKDQEARLIAIKEDGCLCCWIDGNGRVPPDIHHLKRGNIRTGHSATIGLCLWHHRAVPADCAYFAVEPGPSLANGSRTFHAHYGSDDYLLDEQNKRIGQARTGQVSEMVGDWDAKRA